ncbi:hypothetical protein [Streptomyces vinaceus]|uniref:hypothetical protein n=1 Tax=Streptomyces vinaceus TaxID=1960 RepID=UPI00367B3C38
MTDQSGGPIGAARRAAAEHEARAASRIPLDQMTERDLAWLYQRAEIAEAELDQLRADLDRQAQELATWRATVAVLDSGAPGTPRHRAEHAEAAIARAQATCDRLNDIAHAALGTPTSDYDRALHRAATLIRSVLDGPKEPTP